MIDFCLRSAATENSHKLTVWMPDNCCHRGIHTLTHTSFLQWQLCRKRHTFSVHIRDRFGRNLISAEVAWMQSNITNCAAVTLGLYTSNSTCPEISALASPRTECVAYWVFICRERRWYKRRTEKFLHFRDALRILENIKEFLRKGTEINQAGFIPDCLTKCVSILLWNAYIPRGWQMQTWCPSAPLRSQLSFTVACAWNTRSWQVFLLLGVGCKNKQLMVRGRHFNVFTLLFFKKDPRYSATETTVHMKTNKHQPLTFLLHTKLHTYIHEVHIYKVCAPPHCCSVLEVPNFMTFLLYSLKASNYKQQKCWCHSIHYFKYLFYAKYFSPDVSFVLFIDLSSSSFHTVFTQLFLLWWKQTSLRWNHC